MIDQCIRLYGKRLYGLCLFLCANPQDADDLYQDTWLKVVKNISKYDETRAFEPWLTQICVNTYRNTLRRLSRSPIFNTFESTTEKERILEPAVPEQSPDYQALREEVDRLPEKLRMTVILFYFRDLDVKETAVVLGVPPGTVKSRLNKARKLLKEALTDETHLQF